MLGMDITMRVVVLGGGFAGIAAAKKLHRLLKGKKNVEIVLVDRHNYTTMLPALPDVAGGKIKKKSIIESIEKLIPKEVVYKQLEVHSINLVGKQIVTDRETISYDYLIISAGSKTNFYGFEQNLDKLYTLTSLEDAERIFTDFNKVLDSGKNVNLVISGAGFTGIELACCLNHMALKRGKNLSVFLIEKASRILTAISDKMLNEVENETGRLGFKIIKDDSAVSFDGNTVKLEHYGEIPDAFFCWCSGVKNSVPVEGNLQKHFDERIIVDEYLRIPQHPEVFAAGDAAAFKHKGAFLRRSVNYASTMGTQAAKNVAAQIQGREIKPYKPVDLGWVIPVNRTSIGEAFGIAVKGRLGILMHYIICGVKNYSLRNFVSFFCNAFKFALK